ncbi:hypothetical protein [Streptomyces sp. NPDC020817]|uniref:hypothetical protein n=1 Tax=Streptomyces sp. NPDC020817 TaxID=3365095 RepID=UPI0037BE181D
MEDVGTFNHKLLLHGTDQQLAYYSTSCWGAKFEPCQEASGSELHLTEDKSVTTCEMFLVPENVQPVFVGFQGDRDYRNPTLETGTATEVVWKAADADERREPRPGQDFGTVLM